MAIAQYKFAMITFLDILGFKDYVECAKCYEIEQNLEELDRLTNVIDYGISEFQSMRFSDCIVRSFVLDSCSSIPAALRMETLDLIRVQSRIANAGILMRGAIVCGDIYFNKPTDFGPGFNRAYELESQYAKYPRIVVDPKDDLLMASARECEWRDEKLFTSMNDDYLFVDYCRNAGIESKTEIDHSEVQANLLEIHRGIIADKYRDSQSCKIRKKLNWLRKYHNTSVESIFPVGEERNRLIL